MIGNSAPVNPKSRLSALKLAGIYIGTIVGAGFASGQEILQFFGFHGLSGIWGIFLSMTLFVVYGGIAFLLGHYLQASSHIQVVKESAGQLLGTVIDAIITFFLLGAFTAMAAGSGAVFQEQFGVPAIIGNLAMVSITVLTVLRGIHGVLDAISFVAPVLIAAVLGVSGLALFQAPINWAWAIPTEAAVQSWPVSAVAYASYNLVLAIAVLAPTGPLADPDTLKKGALLGGLGLGLGALAIQLALLSQVPQAVGYEIPMLFLARQVLGTLAPFYSLVLLAEVYTTAAGSLYGFVVRFAQEDDPDFRKYTLGAGVLGFAGSLVGFSDLVATLYSAVGYAGFILLISLTIGYFRHINP